jgi:hypothetical protein
VTDACLFYKNNFLILIIRHLQVQIGQSLHPYNFVWFIKFQWKILFMKAAFIKHDFSIL